MAFFPDRSSTSWPRIERAGKFCVNVLASPQQNLCRRFSAKVGDKFAGLEYRLSNNGSPVLDDIVAWIDCALDVVHEAGDHFIVLGRVIELDIARADQAPLRVMPVDVRPIPRIRRRGRCSPTLSHRAN